MSLQNDHSLPDWQTEGYVAAVDATLLPFPFGSPRAGHRLLDDDPPLAHWAGAPHSSAPATTTSFLAHPASPATHTTSTPLLPGHSKSQSSSPHVYPVLAPNSPASSLPDDDDSVDDSKSTFAQSTFNGSNILLGLGLLSLPYAFKKGGLVPTMILIVYITIVCNYTGRMLGMLMQRSWRGLPAPRSYPAIARAAFGDTFHSFTSVLFFAELFAACAMYIMVCADNLTKLFPDYSELTWGVSATLVILPTTFAPNLAFLSNFAIVGVISSFMLCFTLVYESAGHLPTGAETQLFTSWDQLPFAFGLVVVVYAGHGVLPVIRNEMKAPSRFNALLNISFGICTVAYLLTGLLGYLMYGLDTEKEITLNLVDAGGGSVLSKLTTWLIIIVPVCKYALTQEPISISIESIIGTYLYSHADEEMPLKPSSDVLAYRKTWTWFFIRLGNRTLLTAINLCIAWQVPNFGRVTCFVGSFFSFTISTIIPILCYLKLLGKELSRLEYGTCVVLLIINTFMAITGTIAAILSGG